MKEGIKRILPAICIGICIVLIIILSLLTMISEVFLILGLLTSPIFFILPLLVIWALIYGVYLLFGEYKKEGLINLAAGALYIIYLIIALSGFGP